MKNIKYNSDEEQRGQAIYSNWILSVYNLFVLSYNNRLVWKCSTSEILDFYNHHVSNNHLDVGVGTGYYMSHCTFPSAKPRVALMDLNSNCLRTASKKIGHLQPETYHNSVFNPLGNHVKKFDSISACYLIHCVPGNIREKASAFGALKSVLNPGGKLFGVTLLQGDIKRSLQAKLQMYIFNQMGVFHNTEDDLDGLRWALSQHFKKVSTKVIGCAALFWAED
jgi:ubiquinone/menaquinone biosynthesis C-methylase UbiE